MTDPQGWVSVAQATVLVERSRMTVHRWAAARYVRVMKKGRRTLVRLEDLLATEAAIHAGDTPEKHKMQ